MRTGSVMPGITGYKIGHTPAPVPLPIVQFAGIAKFHVV